MLKIGTASKQSQPCRHMWHGFVNKNYKKKAVNKKVCFEWVKASSFSMLFWPPFLWFERLFVWYLLPLCLGCILESPLYCSTQDSEILLIMLIHGSLEIWSKKCLHFVLHVRYCCKVHTRNKHMVHIRNVVKSVNVHSNLLKSDCFLLSYSMYFELSFAVSN